VPTTDPWRSLKACENKSTQSNVPDRASRQSMGENIDTEFVVNVMTFIKLQQNEKLTKNSAEIHEISQAFEHAETMPERDELKALVEQHINEWAKTLEQPVNDLKQYFYALLQNKEDDLEEALGMLHADEAKLLDLALDFNIENLNNKTK